MLGHYWEDIGLPLYQLFGGFRNKVPCYVTCAYYREGKDHAELKDEIQMLVDQGHQGFKAKVGGLCLAEDLERMELVREIIGPERDLMIDVNRAWDLKTAIEGARLLEPLKPTWLEEPVRWMDDRRELKILEHTSIPLSGGESESTSYGCRTMIDEKAIQILQFDCTMFGGFTEGRKMTALCDLNHVDVAPVFSVLDGHPSIELVLQARLVLKAQANGPPLLRFLDPMLCSHQSSNLFLAL